MDKIENPYQMMLERLHILDQSIYVLNLVNNDLRQILHKQYVEFIYVLFLFKYINFRKPLPQFIHDSFKRTTISKSKTSSALPPPPPTGKKNSTIIHSFDIYFKCRN